MKNKGFLIGGIMFFLCGIVFYGSYPFSRFECGENFINNIQNKEETQSKTQNSLQQEWEKFQGEGAILQKKSKTGEEQEVSVDGNYGPHESQKALFQNQLLYFHFQNKNIAEKAQLSFAVHTGTIHMLFENIDTPELKKEFVFSSQEATHKQYLKLSEMGILNQSGDINTIKIRNENEDIAVISYDINIL